MGLPVKSISSLKNINGPLLKWSILHPFKALKIWKISNQVRDIANHHITDPDLDGDYAGGQVDALRHILWMALITSSFNAKTARKIGILHEESNKIDFKKGKLEDYQLPDSASMMMDLLNNEIGIDLGLRLTGITIESLIDQIKKIILEGRAWVIKKDENGNFLDKNNNIIPKELWLKKWNTPKIIVHSNFRNNGNLHNYNRKFRRKNN